MAASTFVQESCGTDSERLKCLKRYQRLAKPGTPALRSRADEQAWRDAYDASNGPRKITTCVFASNKAHISVAATRNVAQITPN